MQENFRVSTYSFHLQFHASLSNTLFSSINLRPFIECFDLVNNECMRVVRKIFPHNTRNFIYHVTQTYHQPHLISMDKKCII